MASAKEFASILISSSFEIISLNDWLIIWMHEMHSRRYAHQFLWKLKVLFELTQ